MELRGELKFLFESNEGNYVYWFERRNKGVFVTATPIDVSAILRERLFRAIRNDRSHFGHARGRRPI